MLGPYSPECPVLRITEVEFSALYKPWKRALIVKHLGGNLGYIGLSRQITQAWKLQDNIVMTDVGNDIYVIKFTKKEDYDTTLFGGPWLLGDHYFTVQRWYPKLCADDASLDKLVVWVRFPSLPLYVYDKNILARLGNEINVWSSSGKFARVSVELDLKKPLISKFIFDNKVHYVEYEGLHTIGFECAIFGHKKEDCPKNANPNSNLISGDHTMGNEIPTDK